MKKLNENNLKLIKLCMVDIQQEIKQFYDNQAEKFSNTRKKQWPEFFYIKEQVEKILTKKWKIKILELWCGDGRLYKYLTEIFDKNLIDYTGVDLSTWLIKIAQKENPNINFINQDMLSFLEKQEQQSYDFVIAIASFQHISKRWERLLILKNIYRILNYDGILQMFNWSFSNWFFKKYTKQIAKSFFIWILSLWTKPINDIYIPWKNKEKIFYRYYHIFFLSELRSLFKLNWFRILDNCYINKKWEKSVSWKDSRNSMIIWKK